jgi:hypothetical protein
MKRKVTVNKMTVKSSRYERVKNLEGVQELYIGCDCSCFHHVIRASYTPKEEMYIDVMLERLSFFRRLWVGLKYIFGLGYPRHYYGEVILYKEKARELSDHLLDYVATFQGEDAITTTKERTNGDK